MMKVKSKVTIAPFITEGKEYIVINERIIKQYDVQQDNGVVSGVHQDHFTVIDEPKIEVGSEWVNTKGRTLTVDYIGKHTVVSKWNDDGKEFSCSIQNYIRFYKPKPKTVTMYFYKSLYGHLIAYDAEKDMFGEPLFTKEIEL